MKISIREFREKKGMSQKAFAALVGCTQANINHIERRGQDIGVMKLAGWADRLNCDFHDLVSSSLDDSNLPPAAGG